MAITDYSSLQSAIADYLARSDLTTQITQFIALHEARMNRNIRVRQMETTATLTTTAGTNSIALPSDYLETRAVQILASPNMPMTGITLASLQTTYADGTNGKPTNYCIVGSNMLLGKTPDSAYSVELTYVQKIAALSGTNTTNWLLTAFPDLYLYGALLEAQPFIQNDARIQVWMGMYDRAMADVQGQDARAKWAGAPLTPKLDVMVG